MSETYRDHLFESLRNNREEFDAYIDAHSEALAEAESKHDHNIATCETCKSIDNYAKEQYKGYEADRSRLEAEVKNYREDLQNEMKQTAILEAKVKRLQEALEKMILVHDAPKEYPCSLNCNACKRQSALKGEEK